MEGRRRRLSHAALLPAEMATRWGAAEAQGAQWYIWNDFALATATEQQVLSLHAEWRRPCVLVYGRARLSERLSQLPLDAPELASRPMTGAFSLQQPPTVVPPERARAITPLAAHELPPKEGQLVAIDAEFVAVTHELTRPGKTVGKTIVVKPARLSLARVSILRGSGTMAGVPFIDAYVQQAEPVVDYLTRYSGLHPGDLDPSVSRHHITTMKAAYLQLRQLVDAGCRFVGHGLQKDFEMINVVVPPEQIVDTVELFYLPGSRRISLRFLAWHLLGQQMSNRLQDTHDSIEDARTALQLYAKYRELSAKGTLQENITNLYAVGRETHWEVP